MSMAIQCAGLMLALAACAPAAVAQEALRQAAEDEARIEALLRVDAVDETESLAPDAALDDDAGRATNPAADPAAPTASAAAPSSDAVPPAATASSTSPPASTAADRLRALTTKPAAAPVDQPTATAPSAAAEAEPLAAFAEDEPLEPLPDPAEIAFADLKSHVGRAVRITSIGGRARIGRVESVDADGVNLRVRAGGGYAQFKLPASQIASIRRAGGE